MSLQAILEQHFRQGGHKSTVLMPLTWLIGMLFLSGTFSKYSGQPDWITFTLFWIAFAVIFIFIACYLYCLFTNPDLIRSEKYVVQKMMIEKGFLGDDKYEAPINIDEEYVRESDESQSLID